VMKRGSLVRELGGTMAGDKQVHGDKGMLPVQFMSELEADQSPHTVAEEREWHIQIGEDNRRQHLNKCYQLGKRLFCPETLASGQSNTPQLGRLR
jgi:hypothetical protein